jgi:hypothetical protein
VLQGLREAFEWSDWEKLDFIQCGVRWVQDPISKSVTLSQRHYTKDALAEIDLKPERRKHREQPLTAKEVTAFQGVNGTLQWVVTQTDPLHQVEVSFLHSEIKDARVESIIKANMLVRKVKANDADTLRYEPCDDEMIGVGWSDASWGNRPDGSSTGGYAIGLASCKILDGMRVPVGLTSWTSHRLKRVSRSSLNSETQAVGDGEDELHFICCFWAELRGVGLDLSDDDSCAQRCARRYAHRRRSNADQRDTRQGMRRGMRRRPYVQSRER